MQASVYRTHQRGIRLPRPLQAVEGNLLLGADPAIGIEPRPLVASLRSQDGAAALPDLINARVRRITNNGIVVSGHEVIARGRSYKSNADHCRQTWWCLVPTFNVALDATSDYDGMMGLHDAFYAEANERMRGSTKTSTRLGGGGSTRKKIE